jgi:integrase
VLRAAIHHAHREGRLTRTVAVHLPDGAEPRDRWLTWDEAAALLRAALREPRVRLYLPLYVLISIYTGARKEAILSLHWSQVDLSAGRIASTRRAPAGRTSVGRASPPLRGSCHICAELASVEPRSASSFTKTGRASKM